MERYKSGKSLAHMPEFANSLAIDGLFTSQKKMSQIPHGQSTTTVDMCGGQLLDTHDRNFMVKIVVIFHQIRSLHGENIASRDTSREKQSQVVLKQSSI